MPDNFWFATGTDFFVDQKIKTKSQFINSIKIVTPTLETYDVKVGKYVNTDMKIILTPNKYRSVLYDLIKTKWLVDSNRLIYLEDSILNKNYSLMKIK